MVMKNRVLHTCLVFIAVLASACGKKGDSSGGGGAVCSTPSAPTVTSPASASFSDNSSTLTISGTCSGSGSTITLGGEVIAADVVGSSLTTSCLAGFFSFGVNKSVDD